MTNDLDALIAEARERAHAYTGGPEADRLFRLADALESTRAELLQERERADEAEADRDEFLEQRNEYIGFDKEARAALSRAEETIEKVRNLPRHELNALVTAVDAHDIDAILTEYDEQKGEQK